MWSSWLQVEDFDTFAFAKHRIDYLACHSYVLAPKAQIKKLQEFSERWKFPPSAPSIFHHQHLPFSTISTFHFPPSAPPIFHHQHLPGLEEGRSGTQSLPWLASTVRWSIVLCRQRVFKLSKVQSFFSSAGKHHCLHWGAVAFARTQWLHPSLLLVSISLNPKPCNEPNRKINDAIIGTTPGIMTHPWMSQTGSGLIQRILF